MITDELLVIFFGILLFVIVLLLLHVYSKINISSPKIFKPVKFNFQTVMNITIMEADCREST